MATLTEKYCNQTKLPVTFAQEYVDKIEAFTVDVVDYIGINSKFESIYDKYKEYNPHSQQSNMIKFANGEESFATYQEMSSATFNQKMTEHWQIAIGVLAGFLVLYCLITHVKYPCKVCKIQLCSRRLVKFPLLGVYAASLILTLSLSLYIGGMIQNQLDSQMSTMCQIANFTDTILYGHDVPANPDTATETYWAGTHNLYASIRNLKAETQKVLGQYIYTFKDSK